MGLSPSTDVWSQSHFRCSRIRENSDRRGEIRNVTTSASLRFAILLLASLTCLVGCRTTAPSDWSTLARLTATIGLASAPVHVQAWQRWGDANLEDGDLLFVRGENRILLGLVDFSELASNLTDSPFSHVALVSREGGQLLVYDIVAEGPRRLAFADFVADRRLSLLAAKRLRPEYRQHAPQAIAFCRQVWQQQDPFDEDFRLDNGRWYCSELIETAYRNAGLALSEPVPIQQLPGYHRVSPAVRQLVLSAKPIKPTEAVFVPGNDTLGMWSSPSLQPLLDPTDIADPPLAPQPNSREFGSPRREPVGVLPPSTYYSPAQHL
jgi:hypothetical protein